MNDELRVENGTETLKSPVLRGVLLEEFPFGVSSVAVSSKRETPEGKLLTVPLSVTFPVGHLAEAPTAKVKTSRGNSHSRRIV